MSNPEEVYRLVYYGGIEHSIRKEVRANTITVGLFIVVLSKFRYFCSGETQWNRIHHKLFCLNGGYRDLLLYPLWLWDYSCILSKEIKVLFLFYRETLLNTIPNILTSCAICFGLVIDFHDNSHVLHVLPIISKTRGLIIGLIPSFDNLFLTHTHIGAFVNRVIMTTHAAMISKSTV